MQNVRNRYHFSEENEKRDRLKDDIKESPRFVEFGGRCPLCSRFSESRVRFRPRFEQSDLEHGWSESIRNVILWKTSFTLFQISVEHGLSIFQPILLTISQALNAKTALKFIVYGLIYIKRRFAPTVSNDAFASFRKLLLPRNVKR